MATAGQGVKREASLTNDIHEPAADPVSPSQPSSCRRTILLVLISFFLLLCICISAAGAIVLTNAGGIRKRLTEGVEAAGERDSGFATTIC